MKNHHLAIGLLLGTALTFPAAAQYGATASSQPKAQPATKADKEDATKADVKKPKVSSDALKDIQALDKAVDALYRKAPLPCEHGRATPLPGACRPRQMLPPPTTTAGWMPMSTTSAS